MNEEMELNQIFDEEMKKIESAAPEDALIVEAETENKDDVFNAKELRKELKNAFKSGERKKVKEVEKKLAR